MMAWNASEYCHQQPALQPPGRRPVAGWLNERYPFTQFHISRQIYMGSGIRYYTKVFRWLSASRELSAGKYL